MPSAKVWRERVVRAVVNAGGFGRLRRSSSMPTSAYGVFDLEAGPITITLPDTGKRSMSMRAISQDRRLIGIAQAPGSQTFTKEQVGTRYLMIVVRTLADVHDPQDVVVAQSFQDAIKVAQAKIGTFESVDSV